MKSNLYWLTGLSGAGKTAIGNILYARLKKIKTNTVYLDGDTLREIFGNNQKYSLDERKNLEICYSKLCKMLTEQGIDVFETLLKYCDLKTNEKNYDSKLPLVLGEKSERDYVFSQSIYPGQTYKTVIRDKFCEYRFESKKL